MATAVPTIKRLDTTVVNRIAAGEVIQRPANALKELIENALDAGSTQIQILVKEGGLKLLQIQDNGHGIRRTDMGIVCERFTTSKLSKFEDLSQIATHGFRGEALASISHVSHVTITTKTADSQCAFRANYMDGKLVPPRPGQSADPKPCAGNNGTQITAEDLFYNVPTRRKALKSASEEYNRILDVVSRYAIHNASVSFSCKKHGNMVADVQTPSNASVVDNIKQIYGASVANELLHMERSFPTLDFKMDAYISNANYNVKRLNLLLFINHRLVESTAVKKMIENVYAPLLPKGSHPFVYISLEINPRNVDVNVHPTKREVHFLNEEQLLDAVAEAMQEKLENANTSRTFYTQTPSSKNVAEYRYVRTDSRARTLDTFLQSPSQRNTGSSNEDALMQEGEASSATPPIKRPRVETNLTSVLDLRDAVRKSKHAGLSAVLSNHTFVGCVDDTLALIQHEEDIEELFYQVVLQEFSNFGCIRLSEPLSIRDCVKLALEAEQRRDALPDHLKPHDTVADIIANTLQARAEMMQEYFSMEIKEGAIHTLPMLLKDYVPAMDKIPLFLLRLGTEVDWETEQDCFDGIAKELAVLFCADPPLRSTSEDDAEYEREHERYLWQVEHLIFPSLKTHFVAPRSLAGPSGSKGYITRVASLPDLYKIFERC
ncbi:histidine kinase-like ATPase [Syncephalastrum racemosum]|uniref:DNA mismatch repair protein MLH1 n=1 Tax=Syncephalastrum racemosum TaxID=13706 RepID=A0A1X2HWG7_SYNRA|nr:histidine kinase-like ATPase [Syncephalastrum racemosum]